jgi:LytS/YehU family sensor histidine kinase
MSKKSEILLHIAIWLVLLLTPLSFLNHGNGVSLTQFLMISVSPLMMMVVFYMNYLWLMPSLFVNGEKKYFWTVNIILCVGLGIGIHFWMSFIHSIFDQDNHYEPTTLQVTFFILRDIFNLVVTAVIAITIRLSLRWYKAEKARREAEAARTEAELRNLHNQISPHFLLNTLNNIYALTAFDQERAQEAIQELSKMLRHMLYENQENEVRWEDEVEFLRSYVNLMKIRLPQNVKVDFKSENTSHGERKVSPLLFISLVENAFKHGVSPIEESSISINLSADDKKIVCDIKNTNHPKTATDRSGHGIGLTQVQRRLDLSYPNQYVWEKGVSKDGSFYRSTITISIQ